MASATKNVGNLFFTLPYLKQIQFKFLRGSSSAGFDLEWYPHYLGNYSSMSLELSSSLFHWCKSYAGKILAFERFSGSATIADFEFLINGLERVSVVERPIRSKGYQRPNGILNSLPYIRLKTVAVFQLYLTSPSSITCSRSAFAGKETKNRQFSPWRKLLSLPRFGCYLVFVCKL